MLYRILSAVNYYKYGQDNQALIHYFQSVGHEFKSRSTAIMYVNYCEYLAIKKPFVQLMKVLVLVPLPDLILTVP